VVIPRVKHLTLRTAYLVDSLDLPLHILENFVQLAFSVGLKANTPDNLLTHSQRLNDFPYTRVKLLQVGQMQTYVLNAEMLRTRLKIEKLVPWTRFCCISSNPSFEVGSIDF
jgi:AAA15 family ATPase/GTPase